MQSTLVSTSAADTTTKSLSAAAFVSPETQTKRTKARIPRTADEAASSPVPFALSADERAIPDKRAAATRPAPKSTPPLPPTSIRVTPSSTGARQRREWSETARILTKRVEQLSRSMPSSGAPFDPRHFAAVAAGDKNFASQLSEVAEEANSLAVARASASTSLAARLCALDAMTARTRDLLGSVAPDDELDYELGMTLRRELTSTNAALEEFRSSLDDERQQLSAEERRLTSEVADVTAHLDAWTDEGVALPRVKSTAAMQRPSTAPSGRSRADGDFSMSDDGDAAAAPCAPAQTEELQDDLADEGVRTQVARIERELHSLGGPSCGWNDEDHRAFLLVRTRALSSGSSSMLSLGAAAPSARDNVFVARATALLGAQDEATVREHAARVSRREELVAQRKHLISEWKRARAARRAAAATAASKIEGGAAAAAATPARVPERPKSAVSRPLHDEAAREAQRARAVDAWRAERIRVVREAARREEDERAKAALAASREATRRARLRAELAKETARRQADEAAMAEMVRAQERETAKLKARHRAIAMVSFRERDAATAHRRRLAREELQGCEARKRERFLQLASEAAPKLRSASSVSQVLRPTTASTSWILQKKESDAEGAKKQPGGRPAPPPSTGRRAQVAWRQGL